MVQTNTIHILDGKEFFNWFIYGSKEVTRHKKYLNQINVFPVADGDTGTNLSVTLNSTITLARPFSSFYLTLQNLSDTALANARGNSGILFASYISGMAKESTYQDYISMSDFSELALKAVDNLYNAVTNPLEGTILSVIRDWANSLSKNCSQSIDFKDLLLKAYDNALISLEDTKNHLDILKKNHLVDSGAKGFVTFLEGINRYLSLDTEIPFFKDDQMEPVKIEVTNSLEYRFCTEAYISSDEIMEAEIANQLRSILSPLGDSLMITTQSNHIRVHIHTNFPNQVMSLLVPFGTIVEQKADDMFLQTLVATKPKNTVGILTDSIADFPSDWKLERRIHTIPIGLTYKDTTYLDKVTIGFKELSSMMHDVENYPNSSQPSPGKIQLFLEDLLEHYESLIVLCVSDKLSGTYESFQRAIHNMNPLGRQISLINTKTNSGAQGLLVNAAVRALENGMSHEETVAHVESLIGSTQILVCLKTLAYAVKSGRVPNTVGKLGIALGIRPIMTIDQEGKGTAFGAAFSQKGITKKIQKTIEKNKHLIKEYCIVHADNPELAMEYASLFTTILGKNPVYVTEISNVVAIHSGLGSVAVCLLKEDLN